jgi:hypothetical protein
MARHISQRFLWVDCLRSKKETMSKAKKFTKQQTFDKVIKGLLKQGQLAYNETEDQCQYLTPSGAKCAAGQLIPSSKYKTSLEGEGVYKFGSYSLLSDAGKLIQGLGHSAALVRDCQGAHDSAARVVTPHAFSFAIGDLIEVGVRAGLRIPKELQL